MKKLFVKVALIKIKKNLSSTIVKEAKNWELPIFEIKWPGAVTIVKYFYHEYTSEQIAKMMGDVEELYEIMQKRFGEDPESGTPYVQIVYGGMMNVRQTLVPVLKQSVIQADEKPADEQPEELTVQDRGANVLEMLGFQDEEEDVGEAQLVQVPNEEGEIDEVEAPKLLRTREDIDAALMTFEGADPNDGADDEDAKEMLGAFLDDYLIAAGVVIDDIPTVDAKYELYLAMNDSDANNSAVN